MKKNKQRIAAKSKHYYNKNKEQHKVTQRKQYVKNKERLLEKQRRYRQANRERVAEYASIYYHNNKRMHNESIRIRTLHRRKVDINYKLLVNLRKRLHCAIRNNQRSGSAVRDLGCSIEELKTYLESKFQPGMTWDNWSPTGWHIDHIVPLKSFDLTDREQLLRACHYTNLQPLWAKGNLKKSNRVDCGKD